MTDSLRKEDRACWGPWFEASWHGRRVAWAWKHWFHRLHRQKQRGTNEGVQACRPQHTVRWVFPCQVSPSAHAVTDAPRDIKLMIKMNSWKGTKRLYLKDAMKEEKLVRMFGKLTVEEPVWRNSIFALAIGSKELSLHKTDAAGYPCGVKRQER